MASFRQKNLKQRLVLISLIVTGTALLLAGVLMFAAELTSLKGVLVRDLAIKADIIGSQCEAALVFNVQRDAEETLGALRADRHVEYAAVYTKEAAVFAEYRREGFDERLAQEPLPPDGHRFGINHLELVSPVILHQDRIGTVIIRSDLQNLYLVLLRYVAAAGLALPIALLAAYVLVSRLQRTITGPVSGLVRLMGRISRDKDFSVRAEIRGPVELGVLAEGFNDMLTAVQNRDRELERHRQELEESVINLQKSTRELQEANNKLKILDKLKSEVISIVSHELRTPLTSIKAFTELILMKPNMQQEKKAKILQTINSESDRLGRLINDLLDLSKLEAGVIQWKVEDVSIEDVVQTAVAGMLPLAQDKGLRLLTKGGAGLPRIPVDRDRLIQVVTNLLSNAIKFTPEGGSIIVETSQEPAPQPQLVVAVSDTGRGIPPEEIDLIFDKFHRSGDTLTSTIEGTGLGLSIARQIIEHFGGRIWATSKKGGGSLFTFTIPLGRERSRPSSMDGNP